MKKGDFYKENFHLTEQVYKSFIKTFSDNNPLHTDPVFAHQKGFKNVVMHGNILNGFISYFIGECLPEKSVIIHKQEIKYVRPVYLNDVLIFYAEIEEVFESVGAIVFRYYFENRDKIKVAKGKFQIGRI